MVPAEWADDGRSVCEVRARLWSRRIQTLKECYSGIANHALLTTIINTDFDLAVIHQIGADSVDEIGRGGVEVFATEETTQLELLRLESREGCMLASC